MKQKYLLTGLILSCVGSILVIVKLIMQNAFPETLSFVAAICLLVGVATNLTILWEARKKAKENSDGSQQ